MMKFGFSCQSLELISHLAQPVCLNKHRGGCSFPLPNQLQIFSIHPFHSYFSDEAPGALFSEFFQKLFRLLLIQKTFPAKG